MTTKTEIGRCRDCKWWDMSYCKKTVPNSDIEMACHDGMWGISGKDSIHVYTGPDFGCIHWESKIINQKEKK